MEHEADGLGPPWAPGYRHVTAGIERVSFRAREEPEDFIVEEVPLFETSGEGSHLYLEIEKTGLGTVDAIRRVARALGRDESEFGFAGRKDSRAVTRQRISVEHVDPDDAVALDVPGVRVLSVERHPHKLRVGQLAGNRFRLTLRAVSPAGHARIVLALEVLEREGLPNYYGSQRFGRTGRTYELGHLLLRGDAAAYLAALSSPEHAIPSTAQAALASAVAGGTSERRRLGEVAGRLEPDLARVARQLARRPKDLARAVSAVPRRTRQFHVSALQSRVFNRVLAQRLAETGSLTRLLPGDVAQLARNGACFPVDEDPVGVELASRAAALELSPSGPIPGHRMLSATGRPGEIESAALAAEGVALDEFGRIGDRIDQKGARRPLRVPLMGVAAERVGGVTRLAFELSKGSYATTLLEELAKDLGGPVPRSRGEAGQVY